MKHAIYSVTRAEVVGPWTLKVEFDDGSEQVINFRPILAGELYGPLQDLEVFNRVRVDPEARTIVWPNGADFDPATLHDWPEYQGEWVAQARKWAKVEAKDLLCVAEGKAKYRARRDTGAGNDARGK